ncbi:hypothetical protein [Catellatospora sp. NPDC049133]|jgi:hypothetical protein|uniref:hypothetical protein n=1 Tax=Catellatospora sp. NPDC049133 TaxID=3155499 RepID=UPI0033D421DC
MNDTLTTATGTSEHARRETNTLGMRRLAAYLVGIGAVLFAAGNAMHPLRHDTAAYASPTWEAAHLTFALGGMLVAAGLPMLIAVGGFVRPHWMVTASALVSAVAFAGFGPGAWFEAFIAPMPGGVREQVEAGPGEAVNAVLGFAWLLATLVYGIGLIWRGDQRGVRAAGGALVAAVVVMVVFPGLPGAEGLWIIPATVVVSLAHLATALLATRPAAAARAA